MRHYRKLLSVLLCVLLTPAVLLLPACGGGEDIRRYAVTASGVRSADGLIYDLYENNAAVITGADAGISAVTVPKKLDGHTVAAIGDGAFSGCADLYYLKVEADLSFVGTDAFSGSGLIWADLGGKVETLKSRAFSGCTHLCECVGLDSVKTIGDMAFYECMSLCTVTLPGSLTELGDDAFSGCISLPQITLPKSLTSMGTGVFSLCESLARADLGALSDVPDASFLKCASLCDVVFPQKLKSVGEQAFRGCGALTRVYLPKTLTSVGVDAFGGCDRLAQVFYSGSESGWSRLSLAEGNDALTATRPYYGEKRPVVKPAAVSYTVPDRTLTEENGAFGSYTYAVLGDGTAMITAYSGTETDVVIPDVMEGKTVSAIGDEVFTNCAFLCSVRFNKSLTRIGKAAFYGCTALSKIEGGEKIDSVGAFAFEGTPWLAEQKEECVVFGDGVLISYRGTDTFFAVPAGVKHIGDAVFTTNPDLICVDLGSGVCTVGAQAFAWCENLTSVCGGGSLKSLGEYAFSGCPRLTYIDLQADFESLGDYAFGDCYALKYACLGNALQRLGSGAFYNCQNLRLICLPASLTELRSSAFDSCFGFLVLWGGSAERFTEISFDDSLNSLSSLVVIPDFSGR